MLTQRVVKQKHQVDPELVAGVAYAASSLKQVGMNRRELPE